MIIIIEDINGLMQIMQMKVFLFMRKRDNKKETLIFICNYTPWYIITIKLVCHT